MIDEQEVKFIISNDDKADKHKLDYYVADEIKLRGIKKLVENDGMIEIAENMNSTEGMTMEPVKLKPASPEDLKQVLGLARKVGLLPGPNIMLLSGAAGSGKSTAMVEVERYILGPYTTMRKKDEKSVVLLKVPALTHLTPTLTHSLSRTSSR